MIVAGTEGMSERTVRCCHNPLEHWELLQTTHHSATGLNQMFIHIYLFILFCLLAS